METRRRHPGRLQTRARRRRLAGGARSKTHARDRRSRSGDSRLHAHRRSLEQRRRGRHLRRRCAAQTAQRPRPAGSMGRGRQHCRHALFRRRRLDQADPNRGVSQVEWIRLPLPRFFARATAAARHRRQRTNRRATLSARRHASGRRPRGRHRADRFAKAGLGRSSVRSSDRDCRLDAWIAASASERGRRDAQAGSVEYRARRPAAWRAG